eukprot:c12713_g1_i1 orf=183-458(-)
MASRQIILKQVLALEIKDSKSWNKLWHLYYMIGYLALDMLTGKCIPASLPTHQSKMIVVCSASALPAMQLMGTPFLCPTRSHVSLLLLYTH